MVRMTNTPLSHSRIANAAFLALLAVMLLQACATGRAPQPAAPDRFEGLASWYGQEFAGRTTANGELFDPMRLTAAHRTLPFGTIVEVTNPANSRSVTVRINDRGPFVGDRVIDLSYGAALKLDLVETGVAPVQARIVRIGAGEREPPQPYVVTIDPPETLIRAPQDAPSVDFPLPDGRRVDGRESAPAVEDDVVEEVVVEEQRAGERVRRRVGADGTTIETITESGRVVAREPTSPTPRRTPSRRPPDPPAPASGFIVQLGAFQIEENAHELRQRVAPVSANAFIENRAGLWRVRVGPFPSRDAAKAAADRLAREGFPGIVLSLD